MYKQEYIYLRTFAILELPFGQEGFKESGIRNVKDTPPAANDLSYGDMDASSMLFSDIFLILADFVAQKLEFAVSSHHSVCYRQCPLPPHHTSHWATMSGVKMYFPTPTAFQSPFESNCSKRYWKLMKSNFGRRSLLHPVLEGKVQHDASLTFSATTRGVKSH